MKFTLTAPKRITEISIGDIPLGTKFSGSFGNRERDIYMKMNFLTDPCIVSLTDHKRPGHNVFSSHLTVIYDYQPLEMSLEL
jgi:hypothetical protein